MVYRISVDTGGTFTDVVVQDADSRIFMSKALTTRERAYLAIEQGLEDIAATMGIEVADLVKNSTHINYGTTRSTNLVVTGQTAKTALITTEGFPDILLFREGGKLDPFKRMHYRGPYIPRYLTFEVDERVTSDGEIYRALDEQTVVDALRQCAENGVEAVAVCLIWSIRNAAHELRIGELIAEHLPGVPFTLSHQVNPTIREYRRASATAIDASLKPSMQKFFSDLQGDLDQAGFSGTLLISTSYGGGWHADRIAEKPGYSIGSGPSMAPLAAIEVADRNIEGGAAHNTVLVTDMGGTTFDLTVVVNGEIGRTNDTWLGGKWTGDITGTRSVDIESIGAGGGSIIWVDRGGLLRVGPQSAGSEPGPACYGRGGSEPTITDAALILGYLDSSNFLGGRLELDKEAATRVMQPVADRLGMTVEHAASAALHISVDNIVTAIREKTVAKGIDTRELVVVAGGGASGLTIALIAEELGAGSVILPKAAGAMSAYGALFSDVVSEFDDVTFMTTSQPEFAVINPSLEKVASAADDFFSALDSSTLASTSTEFYMQARYPMQAWELTIPLGDRAGIESLDRFGLEERFHKEHERVFGVREEGEHIEIIAWGARARAKVSTTAGETEFVTQQTASSQETRLAYFEPAGWVDVPVLSSRAVQEMKTVIGPAIIREDITTIVIHPNQALHHLESGDYKLVTKHVQGGTK